MSKTISSADSHERRGVAVDDGELAYVDTSAGHPVVLLHGNLTSSYLWRNILPSGRSSAGRVRLK